MSISRTWYTYGGVRLVKWLLLVEKARPHVWGSNDIFQRSEPSLLLAINRKTFSFCSIHKCIISKHAVMWNRQSRCATTMLLLYQISVVLRDLERQGGFNDDRPRPGDRFFSQDDEGPTSTHQRKVLMYKANFSALLLRTVYCTTYTDEWDPAETSPKFLCCIKIQYIREI